MCNEVASWFGKDDWGDLADDWFGMDPVTPETYNPPEMPRQVLRAPTLTGGVGKTTQRRARNAALDKRRELGKKAKGKQMLAIGRAKGLGMNTPFLGGMPTATASPAVSGVNYG